MLIYIWNTDVYLTVIAFIQREIYGKWKMKNKQLLYSPANKPMDEGIGY